MHLCFCVSMFGTPMVRHISRKRKTPGVLKIKHVSISRTVSTLVQAGWGYTMKRQFQEFQYITVKPRNSGHRLVLKNCLSLTGVHYWKVILKRLSHLGLNILSAIHGMSAIWDFHYWEVSLYLNILNLLNIN